MADARRVLVTLHLPLEMACAGEIMSAVAKAYPAAVIGENGTIWSRPAHYIGDPADSDVAPSDVGGTDG